jgi:hypothetical protein
MGKDLPASNSGSSRVDKFLADIVKKPAGRGSLVIAIDATGSREETWDTAVHLQAQMFAEVAAIGTLDVKLIFFRGTGRDAECRASEWIGDPRRVASFMNGIRCRAGITQIGKLLEHVIREAGQRKISALVYIGDACEEPRNPLVLQARYLAELGVPIFIFQEGHDPEAEQAFRELAQITHGAFQRFDAGSAKQLGELLRAVAAFAVGGVAALEQQGSAAAKMLLGQVR